MKKIIIKKGLKIGELDAEADQDLLNSCFVDNGQLETILNVSSPASIILGRTGSGKSALVYQVAKVVENSTVLDPNDISVRFLEHSNIIQFFNELGVKLDLFYRILWRHILTVELLKSRYNLKNESSSNGFISRHFGQWRNQDRVKQRALDYFTEWGDKFWLETDQQLIELTSKFTKDVKAQLGAKYKGVDVSLQGAKALNEEERTEIKSLATQVVSSIQITRLKEVLDLLAEEAFTNNQARFYILLDKLDEDWAETDTRIRFIRALIEETKSFRRIPQVKIVTALRRDLLDLVFDKTRDSGFQEEKYEAYLVPLKWARSDLQIIVEARVREVYKRQYTSDRVELDDVFPRPRRGQTGTAIEYLAERTLFRPRDIIQFSNECFAVASDRERISWRAIHAAESVYSNKRLKSLGEEWSEYYPDLTLTMEVLRGITPTFTRSALSGQRMDSVIEKLCVTETEDPCSEAARKFFSGNGATSSEVISQVLMCLYHVGAIGMKISTHDTYIWSHIDQPRVNRGEVKRANHIQVHKMLREALDVDELHITSSYSRRLSRRG